MLDIYYMLFFLQKTHIMLQSCLQDTESLLQNSVTVTKHYYSYKTLTKHPLIQQ